MGNSEFVTSLSDRLYIMSAEENSTRIGYQMKPDERSFVRKFI